MQEDQIFSIKPSNKLLFYHIFKDFGVFIVLTIILMVIKNLIEKVIEIPFNIFGIITTIFFIFTVIMVIKTYIELSTTYFSLYQKNFVYQTGFFTVKRENLEVYRIVDISSNQPFIFRLLGIGNVILHTVDRSDPILLLEGIDNYLEIEKQIKEYASKKRPAVVESYGGNVPVAQMDVDQAPSITDQK